MIYLLYGADTYRSRARLKEFERRFRKEVSHSWFFVDCRDESARTFFQKEGGGLTLFAKKEFGIIRNISDADPELHPYIERELKRWAKDDSVIVMHEDGVPAKNALFSAVKKLAAQVQEFALLARTDAERWLNAELKHRGAELGAAQKRAVLDIAGSDLARLAIELDRVLLGGESVLVSETAKDNELFALGDVWGARDRLRALVRYEELVRRQFPPERILWTLLWHVRAMIAASRGETANMSPYVARKSKEQAKNFTSDALVRAYDELVRLEDKIVKESLDVGLVRFFLTT